MYAAEEFEEYEMVRVYAPSRSNHSNFLSSSSSCAGLSPFLIFCQVGQGGAAIAIEG